MGLCTGSVGSFWPIPLQNLCRAPALSMAQGVVVVGCGLVHRGWSGGEVGWRPAVPRCPLWWGSGSGQLESGGPEG